MNAFGQLLCLGCEGWDTTYANNPTHLPTAARPLSSALISSAIQACLCAQKGPDFGHRVARLHRVWAGLGGVLKGARVAPPAFLLVVRKGAARPVVVVGAHARLHLRGVAGWDAAE